MTQLPAILQPGSALAVRGRGKAWRRALMASLFLCATQVQAELPDPARFGVVIELGDIDRVRQWLDEGLDPEYLADRIGTGLMVAAWEGNVAMMELFVRRGADVNHVNRIGEQALQLAAWKGRMEAVRWLLAHSAQVNREPRQWNALHYATFNGHADIVRLLIERGADVNARTTNGSTALMLAAREGHEELAGMLLGAGADSRPVNDWGDSALTWAMRHGRLRIAKLVVPPAEFGQAVKAPPESFGTPVRSEPAPPGVAELLDRLRIAQALGKPTDELRQAFFDAVARFKRDSTPLALEKSGPDEKRPPRALVITANPRQRGSERVELVHEDAKPAPNVALPTDVGEILREIQLAQSQGRPTAELRKALHEAVARFKKDALRARDAVPEDRAASAPSGDFR